MAAVASVGLIALAGCGTEQGAALFVADERVAEPTVDAYVEGIDEFNAAQGEEFVVEDLSSVRGFVVGLVLYTEIGKAAEVEPLSADEIGPVVNQEALAYFTAVGSEYRDLYLEGLGYQEALRADSEPRALTQGEMEIAVAAAAEDPNLAQATIEQLEAAAGFSDDLVGYVDEFDVAVNPRYGDIEISPLPSVFPVEVPQR
ncbi:hypothetical protein [Glycomyces paridis]|uniref:Uncharacterized protein n=1 Tax=Glycomyces paridis TaxID=2126555 RepID=A0A4S8PFX1_9ACTN|nr:hypothetical protein [Glycomyces paridis]THV28751.1 hypothetical protein E9998_11670 [Glycomyces paridis]